MSYQIIYLNGPSSSGKTTLVKALQNCLEKPFLNVGMDKVIEMMPDKTNNFSGVIPKEGFYWKQVQDHYELQIGPFGEKILKAHKEIILTLAKLNYNIIIDDVSFGLSQVDKWKKLLKDYQVLFIGVDAPIDVIEKREIKRGDRMVGSAKGMHHKVHKNVVYDLMIDTHKDSIEKNTHKIKSLVG